MLPVMPAHPTKNPGGKLGAVNLAPGLHLVATPIGNLRDITLRALEVLAGVDLIVCEDTRVSKKLCDAYDIRAQLVPYNDHNADRQRGGIIARLAQGEKVALISDAGTPLVSDPGFKLVRDCLDLGINVTSLPGANAPLSALQLSGLPSDKFCFIGFLPPKETARRKVLEEWKNVPATIVAFETAPRLFESLRDIEKIMGAREAAVARELTKMFEEVRRGKISELIAHYEAEGAPKGEIVLVIAPPGQKIYDDEELNRMLRGALKDMSTKDAAAFVAESTGMPKKKLYEMALKIDE